MDLKGLGVRTLWIDCDVLQADGGTRTAAISGAYVAVADAVRSLMAQKKIEANPLIGSVAAISVGMVGGEPALDLCYAEDAAAEVDMNVVMTGEGKFVEVQGTAEGEPFSQEQMDQMLALARTGIGRITEAQATVLHDRDGE